MSKYEMRFTTGQFAKLHHINKRTLHYYDSIGLFSPSIIGENSYRYYTYQQSTKLEMILTMRELNMSIEEIDAYLKNRSSDAFQNIMNEKIKDIDQSIQQLKAIKSLLINKEKQCSICAHLDFNSIEIVECADEYLLLSKSMSGAYDDQDFAVFVEHAGVNQNHRIFNLSYGSMISVENILDKKYEEYSCFFTKMGNKNKKQLFLKEKGTYIRAYCKGDWIHIPQTYERIVNYASKHQLKLSGYAYEEGLNEMAIANMDEYITQIMIRCD
ncbi:MAG: MerR family transcriptional regulator [Erysipelotrichaceae bacterium]